MAVQKISVEKFIECALTMPVIDVRSPGEYMHAQFPGAISLPLFSDEERKVTGTLYKQNGRDEAVKKGLDFFGTKMTAMLDEAEKVIIAYYDINKKAENKKQVLVHCWRGGMRSAGVAWLLDLYGFEVYTLSGGYKAYRNWVLAIFEKEFDCTVLGGYTGSGKTEILHAMSEKGNTIIDLEGLAKHKGSAFGGIEIPQPSQEMFENQLAMELHAHVASHFWLEDESQRIGNVMIPNPFWVTMRASQVIFINIPFEERLDFIVENYGQLQKQYISDSITRIRKRLGPMATRDALAFLEEGDLKNCFDILLAYYDKHYAKGLNNRKEDGKIPVILDPDTVDDNKNAQFILAQQFKNKVGDLERK